MLAFKVDRLKNENSIIELRKEIKFHESGEKILDVEMLTLMRKELRMLIRRNKGIGKDLRPLGVTLDRVTKELAKISGKLTNKESELDSLLATKEALNQGLEKSQVTSNGTSNSLV
jgi:hypothetical protein